MSHGNTPQTGAETGKLNASAFAQRLGELVPKDIEAVLEGEVLTAQADRAIHYISATMQKLSQLPRQQQKAWLDKNPQFLVYLESVPTHSNN